MSEKLLESLLRQEISLDELKIWLCGKALNFQVEFSPQEFINYFITYLRDGSSRYVQSSAVSTLHSEQTARAVRNTSVTKKNKINTIRPSLSVSYDGNMSVHTSTPKRRSAKSFNSSEAFNDSPDNSFKHNRSNLSMDHKSFPTLESYLTESLFSSSKENVSTNNRNRKKKKCLRNSCSPVAQGNDGSLDKCKHELVSRRIKPTEILDRGSKPNIIGSNSFSFAQSNCELAETPSSWQRSILREERQKIAARSSDQLITVAKHIGSKPGIKASLELVVDKPKLSVLALVYSSLLDLGLVLSLCSELHFVLTLLLAGSQRDEEPDDLNIVTPLSSVHDCVYLAARVLEAQIDILRLLNRASLKLLCENQRVKDFCPDLSCKLAAELNREVPPLFLPSSVEHATFVPDTDSRDNFPDGPSFAAFCKQRDGFCELVRLWEEGHTRPGWNYGSALGVKTRGVLLLHKDPANFLHLARLFKHRLLGCAGKVMELPDLPDLSTDKLHKLNTRLENGGSQAEFPQRQEFYKEFVKSAYGCCPGFVRQLEHCLAQAVVRLQDEFNTQQAEIDCTIDTGTINVNYISYLKSSRLLAKFLGYIQALPYKSEVPPSGAVLKSLLSSRKNSLPIIDLERIIKTCIEAGQLLVTLPWVTEFLRQLDTISLQLPAYERVLQLLFGVYFSEELRTSHGRGSVTTRLCLGRLFEAMNFPRYAFYAAMAEHLQVGSESRSGVLQDQLEVGSSRSEGLTAEEVSSKGDLVLGITRDAVLKSKLLVGEQAMYECAPALTGLRTLLATGCAPVCIRYIRPVTAVSADVNKKREQKQLEDVFFHGHPESMRRLVDFTAERISSAIVSMIKRSRVPHAVQTALAQLQAHVKLNRTKDMEKQEAFLRAAIQKARDIAEKELGILRNLSSEDARYMAKNRSDLSIPALLPHDVHPVTAVTCVNLTVRKATDRVTHWMEQTLNIALIMDPLTRELSKIEEEAKTKQNNRVAQYLTLQEFSAVKLLIDNKQLMFTAQEKTELLTAESLQSALQYTKETVRRRKDINTSLRDAISAQIIDLALTIIVYKPELVVENVGCFVECLEVFVPREGSREGKRSKEKCPNVLNARNVYLVCEGPDSVVSWMAYRVFVTALLKRRVLSPAAFESQVLKLFQSNFPEVTFSELAINVKQIIDDYGVAPEMIRAASCLATFLVDDLS